MIVHETFQLVSFLHSYGTTGENGRTAWLKRGENRQLGKSTHFSLVCFKQISVLPFYVQLFSVVHGQKNSFQCTAGSCTQANFCIHTEICLCTWTSLSMDMWSEYIMKMKAYLSLSNLFSVLFLHIQAGQYTLLNLVEGYPLLLVDQNMHKDTDQYHCHDGQNKCQRLWQMHVSGSGEKA